MSVASAVSIACYFGLLGAAVQPYSPFVAAVVSFVMVPVIALATGGRYYLHREPDTADVPGAAASGSRHCAVCASGFEQFDTLHCPFHGGDVCSLCCTVESSCGAVCKTAPQTAVATA